MVSIYEIKQQADQIGNKNTHPFFCLIFEHCFYSMVDIFDNIDESLSCY